MKLLSITINVDRNRRVILHPEGGLDLQAKVELFGWVSDNDADVADALLADLLKQAGNLANQSANKINPSTYYVVDDNGEAASWYRNGPDKGRASGHSDRASAERELHWFEQQIGLDGAIVTEEPPVPKHAHW